MKKPERKVSVCLRIKPNIKKSLQEECKNYGYRTYTSLANAIIEEWFEINGKINSVQEKILKKSK
nr:MAG TPA: repressor [Caudoviricetes sp.]